MHAVSRNTLVPRNRVICDDGYMPQEPDDMFVMTHHAIRKRARPEIISERALRLGNKPRF